MVNWNGMPLDQFPECRTIGDNCRIFREALSWSQADLAKRARTSQAYISVFEAYGTDAKVSMIVRLSSAFGRPAWHFWVKDPPMDCF